MIVAFAYLVVSLAFVMIIGWGSREKKRISDDTKLFRYQRTILVVYGIAGFAWGFLAIITIMLGFPHGGISFVSMAIYAFLNTCIMAAYFYAFFWYRAYSLEIAKNLTIKSLGGTKIIYFDKVVKAEIIEGKDTTRMVIYLENGKKITFSGLLIESNLAFEEIKNKLLINGRCIIRRRSYAGKWTAIQ